MSDDRTANAMNTESAGNSYSEAHPHEPDIAPVYDDEGRCLVCGRDYWQSEAERYAQRNGDLLRMLALILWKAEGGISISPKVQNELPAFEISRTDDIDGTINLSVVEA